MDELNQRFEKKIFWHALTDEQILTKLQTRNSGLKAEEADNRIKEYGKNSLPEHKPPTAAMIFLHQFLSPLIYVLLVAGVISVLIGDLKDAFFIFAVILLNAALGTYQEWKAEKSAAALANLLTTVTIVKRDGEQVVIDTSLLVPGDIVLLESGNRVPADIRIISEKSFEVDESLLTGESVAVGKEALILPEETEVHERSNMVFAGTNVTHGRCTGIVVETGICTQIGRIAESVTKTKGTKPPLIIRMERFSRKISYIVLVACLVLGSVALYQGMPYVDVFFFSVALVVAAIPEGLPVAMTVALSIATSRMAKRNVIVRKLAAVESLGSCTCIASDKTGTLTLNRQTAKTIWLPSKQRFDLTGEGYSGDGEILPSAGNENEKQSKKQLIELAQAVTICNEAQLNYKHDKWDHQGDTVDVALLAVGYKAGINPSVFLKDIEIIGEIPYESEIRFSARFYHNSHGKEVAVKGATETILNYCDSAMVDGKTAPLNRKDIEKAANTLAEEGYRVIAVAKGEVHDSWSREDLKKKALDDKDLPKLTLIGIVGLIDPVRDDVKESIDQCREAGVKVVMITGDHPATALAIAKELDIAKEKSDVVTGKDLEDIGSADLPEFMELVGRTAVFARVTPMQKLEIVSTLMKLGHFVAVTGDGVNDVPALHKANIGVAMGSGTDIAKETASIIVMDDSFASIVAGIEEGRYAYNNIRKVIYLLISQGTAEILLFTAALLAGMPLPLIAVQLLWLNLATNGIQDVALAFEAGEKGVMNRPPRKPKENIFDGQMITQTVLSGLSMAVVAFAVWWWLTGSNMEEYMARNILLLLMVMMENFHVLNCRSEHISAFKIAFSRNIPLIFGIIIAQVLHVFSMFSPFMQSILKTAPVDFLTWIALIPLAAIVLVNMEIFKYFQRKRRKALQAMEA